VEWWEAGDSGGGRGGDFGLPTVISHQQKRRIYEKIKYIYTRVFSLPKVLLSAHSAIVVQPAEPLRPAPSLYIL
jgi:hypothetical protein